MHGEIEMLMEEYEVSEGRIRQDRSEDPRIPVLFGFIAPGSRVCKSETGKLRITNAYQFAALFLLCCR